MNAVLEPDDRQEDDDDDDRFVDDDLVMFDVKPRVTRTVGRL